MAPGTTVTFAAFVVTCEERRRVLDETLANLRVTDWGAAPGIQMDDGAAPDKLARIHATWLKALESVASGPDDFALILEDDLEFNRHLRYNLLRWEPLRGRDGNAPFFGTVYNADQRPASWRPTGQAFFVAKPRQLWGAQAIVLSRLTARFCLRHWSEEGGAADLRMPRLASRWAPVYVHSPSLVQHTGGVSTWGGLFIAPTTSTATGAPRADGIRAARGEGTRAFTQLGPSEARAAKWLDSRTLCTAA